MITIGLPYARSNREEYFLPVPRWLDTVSRSAAGAGCSTCDAG
jgi:hypothetical protein